MAIKPWSCLDADWHSVVDASWEELLHHGWMTGAHRPLVAAIGFLVNVLYFFVLLFSLLRAVLSFHISSPALRACCASLFWHVHEAFKAPACLELPFFNKSDLPSRGTFKSNFSSRDRWDWFSFRHTQKPHLPLKEPWCGEKRRPPWAQLPSSAVQARCSNTRWGSRCAALTLPPRNSPVR